MPPPPFFASAALLMQTRAGGRLRRGRRAHFLPESPSVTSRKPLGLSALEQERGCPRGPAAHHRSMAVIGEGNYTHNLFNGPQVQQRREAHKDPDQGGLLLHRREQEVQEHISEFPPPPLSPPLQSSIKQECASYCCDASASAQSSEFRGRDHQFASCARRMFADEDESQTDDRQTCPLVLDSHQ